MPCVDPSPSLSQHQACVQDLARVQHRYQGPARARRPALAGLAALTRLGALAGLAGLLAGCADALDRRETIALQAGEAQAWNRALHTVDPFPREAQDTDLPGDGERLRIAAERHRANTTPIPRGLAGLSRPAGETTAGPGRGPGGGSGSGTGTGTGAGSGAPN